LALDAALIGTPDWFAYGESSKWSETGVAGAVALVEEPSTELVSVSTPLLDETAYTMVGFLEASAPALLVTLDWDEATVMNPANAGVRMTNVSGGDVDTFLVSALTPALAPGESARFVPFDFGAAGTGFYLFSPTGWSFEHLATQDEPASEGVDVVVFSDAGSPPVKA
jgi:hypothetical protein